MKIINNLHKNFQGFNLGQQLPVIHITDNGLIFTINLWPFYTCCARVLFLMFSVPYGVSMDGKRDLIIINQALTDTNQAIRL